jgi:large repetitive protein
MLQTTLRRLPFLAALITILGLSGCGSGGDLVCGDGTVGTGETCDDGNTVAGDGCSATCQTESTPATCGDGTVDSDEQCDDGNTTNGDGCSSACKTEVAGVCGDGTVNIGETCDDGNTTAGDGCSATCQTESGPVCGNGTKEGAEQCDDGNTTAGDGCSATCQTEVPGVCGDGTVSAGEECDDGNMVPADGCEPDCTKTKATEVVCPKAIPPTSGGTCEVKAGDASKLLLGTVLVPGTIYRNGQVLVDATGKISCVGCACDAEGASATTISCPTGVISPALINTHDHITFTQNNPAPDTGERYEQRHDWRVGKNGHTKIPSAGSATNDEISWGELRFLMGGATSTVGSGSMTGLLRNLDKAAAEEGLGQKAVDFQTFPLGDSNGTQLASGCGYPKIITSASITAEDAFFPHVSEGIDAFAENEFLCMSSSANGGQDLVQPQSAFIHAVGLKPADYADMAQKGTALIWSPRSNISLYGDTAIVTEASRLGALIALGTDWMPSGSMNMLRELQCADSMNTKAYNKFFSDEQLWAMATANAAAATATDDVIGTLAKGKIADITIFDGKAHKDHRAVIDAAPQDVVLVLRGGKVLYGDQTIVTAVPASGACDQIDVCGTTKQVCLQSEINKNLAALKTSVGGIYPAFFCGTPTNEPSCVPQRAQMWVKNGSNAYTGVASVGDADGDGIPDATDNCPSVFNPIRPLDAGKQADFDADGVGDACDVCPLNANTTTCTTFDPNDADGDTVPNATDNCPDKANPTQVDSDSDGKGDVCDLCPMVANPGNAACPGTIYAIKDGTIPVGSNVALTNQLVTAVYSKGALVQGFYLQVAPTDAGYMGADNSGVYVYNPNATVKVGDRVSLTTTAIANFNGQIQLTGPTVVIDASLGEASPPPVAVTTAEIATGGARAAKLESVIVQVKVVTATDIAPTLGAGDVAPINEFVVDDGTGGVRVNDILFLLAPPPALNDTFASINGVLDYRNANSKIEPRSAADFVAGQAKLSAFSPATSFLDVGQTGSPTYPTALTVKLSSAVAADTFVAITSSDPASLTVVGGGVTILAGQTSAPVLLDGLAQSAGVTLTATYNAVMLTATVRVLGAAELPVLTAMTPAASTIAPAGTATFTVTLDIPAPVGGTTVALALTPANAGVIPANVVVPAGQTTATFDYVDGSMTMSASITATLGAASFTSTIDVVVQMGGLVINEVDYDMVGTDNAEFVEIYNGTGAAIDLTSYSLVLINGSNNTTYTTVKLGPAGMLASKGYLVVGAATVTVPATALKLNFVGATDQVQNGAPDGIALINTATSTLVDAFCYEGAMTSTTVTGLPGMVSLVEGTFLPVAIADSNMVAGSLSRLPNGNDTNNAATDWNFSTTSTPGAANVP